MEEWYIGCGVCTGKTRGSDMEAFQGAGKAVPAPFIGAPGGQTVKAGGD